MTEELVLFALLLTTVVLSLALILAATAMFGRKLADLEYQAAAQLNGVRWIQAWINIRMQANRIGLGLAFLVVSILAVADVAIINRTWVSRIIFALVLLVFTAAAVMDWVDERRQVRILLKQQAVTQPDPAQEPAP